jgi:hypothetical protein
VWNISPRLPIAWSYLPPILVYFAAGFAGITDLATTFFVKERLSLSAEFLAGVSFWVGLPWALKVPIGHFVDIFWRFKGLLICFGSLLLTTSFLIMLGLIDENQTLKAIASPNEWYVFASLLSPIGYMLQDTVADAMTIDAVRKTDGRGRQLHDSQIFRSHATMQSAGRTSLIAGTVLIGVVNIGVFQGIDPSQTAGGEMAYRKLYLIGFTIPLLAAAAALLNWMFMKKYARELHLAGVEGTEVRNIVFAGAKRGKVQWPIVWFGSAFAATSIVLGLSGFKGSSEVVFVISLIIILCLMRIVFRDLPPEARIPLLATAFSLFIFRAMPKAGNGATWWMIDVLAFDQQFLAKLDLWSNLLGMVGLFAFTRFFSKSVGTILITLSIAAFLLSIPNIAMFYGFHEWTSERTGGLINARFIALADTAVESPLTQLAWIPMLAWIASSAPTESKATYFALMSSFFNLARSCSHLFAKYLNGMFTVSRQVVDKSSGEIVVSADYSQLGRLLILVTLISTVVPIFTVILLRHLTSQGKRRQVGQLMGAEHAPIPSQNGTVQ